MTAKKAIARNVEISRLYFEFDESIVDSLNEHLQRSIGNAIKCNVPYAAYYVCKYHGISDYTLEVIIDMLDLSVYPEYWIETMLRKVEKLSNDSEYSNTDWEKYIQYLAMYPQENCEDNLDFNIEFLFPGKYEQDSARKYLNMPDWEYYFYMHASGWRVGDHPFLSWEAKISKLKFLRALKKAVDEKIAHFDKIARLERREAASRYIQYIIETGDKINNEILDWYIQYIPDDCDDKRRIMTYIEELGEQSALNIDFEEAI